MNALVIWWLGLEALAWAALPLGFALFGPKCAYGYPVGRTVALVLLAYIAWLLGFVIPLKAAVGAALLLFAGAAAWAGYRQRASIGAWLRDRGLREILFLDALWTAGFLFFAWQRSLAPDIFGAEKYMDFAFLNALARADGMPPEDPWMAGYTINYYYFGYWCFALLARLAPLPTEITYNLCVATIGGLAFSQTAAAALVLTQSRGLAVLGGALSSLLGNLDGLLQTIERHGLRGMDYWRSSRVVGRGDTINEFPFFSTIHGDLHPHFMVLPVSLAFLVLLLDERTFGGARNSQAVPGRPAAWAAAAFLLGTMVVISPWEAPAAAMLLFLLGSRSLPWRPLLSRGRIVAGLLTAAALVVGIALYLPFYVRFESFGQGVGFRLATTRLGEFLTVFGALLFAPAVLVARRAANSLPGGSEWRHLAGAALGLAAIVAFAMGNAVLPLLAALVAAALTAAYRSDEAQERAGFLLISAAAVMLLVCEVAYIRDSYGERLYRMNTVFKFYFQAWAMLAVAAPWALGRLLREPPRAAWARAAVPVVMAALLAGAACYPLGVTLDRMRNPHWTLDGNAYLRRDHPDDFAAIQWLRNNVKERAVLLEATGNPYSYFARFASNTGLPTVLGWGNHEGLWRQHEPEVGRRIEDVRRMYTAGRLEAVSPLLDRYGVEFVVVGELERRHYGDGGLAAFASLEKVFEHGQTALYRR